MAASPVISAGCVRVTDSPGSQDLDVYDVLQSPSPLSDDMAPCILVWKSVAHYRFVCPATQYVARDSIPWIVTHCNRYCEAVGRAVTCDLTHAP